MIYENLIEARNDALKKDNKEAKTVLNSVIDTIQKMAITPKGRISITDELAIAGIQKEIKMLKEQIETCPDTHRSLKESYTKRLSIIKPYAPEVLEDREDIAAYIQSLGFEIANSNRKKIMSALSGKVNMRIANEIITEILTK